MDPSKNVETIVELAIDSARRGDLPQVSNALKAIEEPVLRKTAYDSVKEILKNRGYPHLLHEAREKAQKGFWGNADTLIEYAKRIANICQSDAMMLKATFFGWKLERAYADEYYAKFRK